MHTTDLTVNTLLFVNTREHPAVNQKLAHDVLSVTTQETQHIGPWACLESDHMRIRYLQHDSGDIERHCTKSLVLNLTPGRKIETIGQHMLRFGASPEEMRYNIINYLEYNQIWHR